jgi:uncharacterized protein (DUF362 family)
MTNKPIKDFEAAVQPEPALDGRPRVYIDRLEDDYESVISRGFAFLGPTGKIRAHDRVVIKPNLTYPTYRPGVMTNPEAVEALIRYLKNFTSHITVCEADSGGYNPFSMNEVFRSTGLDTLTRNLGVGLVNLSEMEPAVLTVPLGFRKLRVSVARFLMEETDVFITAPVPKVHMNTVISVAIKNQWGLIRIPAERLRLHPYFKEVVYALNRIHPRTIAVIDGKYGLTRSGPMLGDPLPLNWLMVSDDVVTADCIVAQLLGFHPSEVPYLKWILRQRGAQEPVTNTNWLPFATEPFYLKRAWTDYPGLWAFHSRALAWLAYESSLSGPLHKLLYRFRKPFY